MIELMARERPIAHLPAVAMCLLLLFSLTGTGAAIDDLDTGERTMVNNVWIDVPLTQVFRDISIETGVVIAVGPQVPDIIVSLDAGLGKPLQECLRELVAGQGLYVHKENDRFYLVSSGNPSSPSFGEIAKSKRLYLKYITAKHLRSSLPPSVQQYVSSGERVNEVLIYTVPEIMNRIMEIVRKLDVPQPQVVLEVLVVELEERATEEFGIDWEYTDPHNTFSMEAGLGAFTGMAQYTSVPKSQLTSLLLTLRALVGEKKANIRSRPRVATLNGQEAIIDISLDEYFTVVTDIYTAGTLRTELQVITSGVLLKITPHIGDNSDITVDVLTEVSDVASRQNQLAGNESGDLPIIRRRKADTTVRVKEGDAIVIGGLIETQQRSEDKRVPFLSSIPLVGGIFTTKDDSTLKKEVIIFITPRLIEEGKIAVSRHHELISPEQELESLGVPAGPFKMQPENRRDGPTIEQELRSLLEIISVLDVQREHPYSSLLPLEISDEEIDLSGRHELLDVGEEIETLQEVVALLDVQPQPRRNSLDINNEP
jgi:type II secretory pathway component GspD/PulD (secretin)